MKKCYLCGAPADTQDHIPPRSFFPKPYPPDLLTIPSCFKCNNSFSALDEKMRFLLASDEHANESAKRISGQKIFTENSVKRREFKAVASSLKTFPVRIDDVIVPGHTVGAPTQEVFSFVQRIVRGLVYKFYPALHDPKAHVLVECISTVQFKNAKNIALVEPVMQKLEALAPQMKHDCYGDGVLDFMHQGADEGTGWILSFYRGTTFFAVHSLNPPPPPPTTPKAPAAQAT